jgi:hypothetical protein
MILSDNHRCQGIKTSQYRRHANKFLPLTV